MPTGYTYKIEEGCTFEEYAKSTLRAMGACIMLREENSNVEATTDNVNDESTYHEDNLKKALKDDSQSDDEILMGFQQYKEQSIEGNYKSLKEALRKDDLYRDMLDKCLAFEAPTVEHENWKKFMINQIKISTDFDTSYYEESLKRSKELTPEEYLQNKRECYERNIEYHSKNINKSKKLNNDRSEWVRQALDAIESHT